LEESHWYDKYAEKDAHFSPMDEYHNYTQEGNPAAKGGKKGKGQPA